MEGNDFVQNIALDTDEQQRLIIWKVREKCLLICLFDLTIPMDDYAENIEEALELIEQSKKYNSLFISFMQFFNSSNFYCNSWKFAR